MNIPLRHEAQLRADQIHAFQREMDALEQEGVVALDAAERERVAEHHRELLAQYERHFDIDRNERASQLSLGMRIASLFGALALSASVFFLFYQFWGRLSTTTQVIVLIVVPLSMLGITTWVQHKDASGYFAKLAAMVAFVCFVLNVTMLGQIFNITPSDKALLPWAALAFLLAYACDLKLLLVTGILCLVAFVAARTGTWGGMYWLSFGERPENFFPAAALLLVLPGFVSHKNHAGFLSLYRIFGLLTIFLPVLVMGNWGDSSYLAWDTDSIEALYQVAGFAGSALAVWFGVRRRWMDVVNTGVTFFIIFFYTKLFDWWWESMPKYLFFLVLGLVAVLFLLVLKRLRATSYSLFGGQS
ncbi:MAG: DUF2157 domain-containing protein [Gallionella sp.]|nr:DUF2157 domain-containing protein [Gallionella sp.]